MKLSLFEEVQEFLKECSENEIIGGIQIPDRTIRFLQTDPFLFTDDNIYFFELSNALQTPCFRVEEEDCSEQTDLESQNANDQTGSTPADTPTPQDKTKDLDKGQSHETDNTKEPITEHSQANMTSLETKRTPVENWDQKVGRNQKIQLKNVILSLEKVPYKHQWFFKLVAERIEIVAQPQKTLHNKFLDSLRIKSPFDDKNLLYLLKKVNRRSTGLVVRNRFLMDSIKDRARKNLFVREESKSGSKEDLTGELLGKRGDSQVEQGDSKENILNN